MTTNNHESEPTPRTDDYSFDCSVTRQMSDGLALKKLVDFARTLERELNEANEKLVAAKRLQRLTEDNEIRWMQEHTKLQSQLLTAQEGAKQIELRANEEARDLSAQIVTAQKTIGEMREALEKAKIKHTFKL